MGFTRKSVQYLLLLKPKLVHCNDYYNDAEDIGPVMVETADVQSGKAALFTLKQGIIYLHAINASDIHTMRQGQVVKRAHKVEIVPQQMDTPSEQVDTSGDKNNPTALIASA